MADEIEAARLVVENHELGRHGSLEERLAECERILGEHGLDIEGLRGDFTAHAEEPVELVEIEVEAEDDAQVDVDATEAEAEPGGEAEAGAGDDEREATG